MIKIEIDDKIKTEIEKLHWKWFWNRAKVKKINFKFANGLSLSLKAITFFEIFFNWDHDDLEDIITSNYDELTKKTSLSSGFYKNYEKNLDWLNKACGENTKKIIQDAFGYNNFENGNFIGDDKWSAYKFTQLLNLDSCPYCGRQYIFTIGDNNEKKGRPQIDHFFPQDDYPYLSCSIYNFIPSCPACNLQKKDIFNKFTVTEKQNSYPRLKWENNFASILYPYTESFEDKNSKGESYAKFHVFYKETQQDEFLDTPKSKTSLNDVISVGIKVNDSQIKDKIHNSIEAFHLNELYSCHKIELEDLLTRYRNYSKPKIDEITKLIVNAQLNIQASDDTVNQVAKIYTKRIKRTILGLPLGAGDKQYPLRKFKEDIIEQLDNTRQKMKDEAKSNK